MGQDQRRHVGLRLSRWLVVLFLAGCSAAIELSQPPNLYLDGRNYPEDLVPASLRVLAPPMFFVTDREPQYSEQVVTGYGSGRSNGMAFGRADVRFGAADWPDLMARTHLDRAGRISRLQVEGVTEVVRFSDTPLSAVRQGGKLAIRPEAQAEYDAQAQTFKDGIRQELRRTGNSRVLIFVHGVRNEFSEALQTLANLWHFSGRRSLPIVFSWPAGNDGVLGYFRDRESGDFSAYHAKEFLRLLAEIPEVKDIDIVVHSRGTSVMTQALRELVIHHRAKGHAPKTKMKTGTLILAAPDLDTGIVRQRLLSEHVSEAFEQINIYVNPDDVALRLSSILANAPRIGAATDEDFQEGELDELRRQRRIHFIRVENSIGSDSHSYFRANPAVLSDIVLALRTRAFPGGSLRPLEEDPDRIWRLHPDYPLARLPDLRGNVGR